MSSLPLFLHRLPTVRAAPMLLRRPLPLAAMQQTLSLPSLAAARRCSSKPTAADEAEGDKAEDEGPADTGPTKEGSSAPSGGPTETDSRTRVLEAALLEVPALGWTTDALTAGATACGLSPMAHGLLPRGPVELVEYFSASCDARLATEIAERTTELAALEVHNRLLVAMQARLRMVAPHAATWPQALALRALPANLPNTLRDAHSLAEQLLAATGEDGKAPLLPQPIDPTVKLMSVSAPWDPIPHTPHGTPSRLSS